MSLSIQGKMAGSYCLIRALLTHTSIESSQPRKQKLASRPCHTDTIVVVTVATVAVRDKPDRRKQLVRWRGRWESGWQVRQSLQYDTCVSQCVDSRHSAVTSEQRVECCEVGQVAASTTTMLCVRDATAPHWLPLASPSALYTQSPVYHCYMMLYDGSGWTDHNEVHVETWPGVW